MQDHLVPISIVKDLKESYLSYAMSVIVSRAIPDVRDGLKPVHRRILYAMSRAGYDHDKPYKKSARIVGDVMGKFHPHGDAAIYDSLVRMAQTFSLLVPLIDGQGNFGSIDGDPPASMRYTEVRLERVSHFLLKNIDENLVDFRLNYDGHETEPVVLPAQFPNVLVNGASGVAVGMATNIPSHNLGEVIDACITYIDNPEVTLDQLLNIIPGPDFPTGGVILGRSGIKSAFATGRGTITIQGKTHLEDVSQERKAIVIDEIPYQVNKVMLIEKISDLVKDKRIEGITSIRDESDRHGIRIVIDIKKDAASDFILNQILCLSPLRSNFSINTLVLKNSKPTIMTLKEILCTFVAFRKEILVRKTEFRLRKTREKAHLYIGLYIAILSIDEVIHIFSTSKDPLAASIELLNKEWQTSDEIKKIIELISDSTNLLKDGIYRLTELQIKAILDIKLQRLTGLEKGKLESDLYAMVNLIKEYITFLNSETQLMNAIKVNLQDIKSKFAISRKTAISDLDIDIDAEDLIPQEEMVITVTMNGYIKRVKLSHYRTQRRGGKGKLGQGLKKEDVIIKLFVGNTHTSFLFFSNIGKVYRLKVYKLPLAEPTARGRALVNIFPLCEGEAITNIMPLPYLNDKKQNIMFATAHGNVRRNALEDFQYIPINGKIAIKLASHDQLISVKVCDAENHIILSTRYGKSIRFIARDVRKFKSRSSDGVRGIKLAENDSVISMSVLNDGINVSTEIKHRYLEVKLLKRLEVASSKLIDLKLEKVLENLTIDKELFIQLVLNEEFLLTITENGFGKRTSSYEYRITNRGGVGITNILTTKRNGGVIASFPVAQNDNVILITDKGKLIRISVYDIRIAGRSTQGVTLFKTENKEKVVSVAKVEDSDCNDHDIKIVDIMHINQE
ncbi:DNA topoisomerase (ATP-hydrolyzing) subunit A [Wolbachia endosymbiont of Howardula sp.]|uniref:DNA topoisomerase (ATP-hydrolyzing) subunit A n=1 Tax=Wolbachia endosymbiont of Howardula sp. TaxID=2916816 RepID=UPI00217CF027|nr:DNA topoisomerase (ATP-hydrolyzing) subunit A [Wolbachia endosymbiont of Howardula sp.]UWI83092.1 DNA topoisomerase (ATP-hydrolyzing) subunit A [Wolbachia endosymbiont of Howardula sp.]